MPVVYIEHADDASIIESSSDSTHDQDDYSPTNLS
jgi:hypothetical protein